MPPKASPPPPGTCPYRPTRRRFRGVPPANTGDDLPELGVNKGQQLLSHRGVIQACYINYALSNAPMRRLEYVAGSRVRGGGRSCGSSSFGMR